MSTMAYEMKKKFDKYWEGLEINKLLIVSSVLDPRSKMGFVTICFERLYGKDTPKCMEMKEAIVEVLRKLYEVYSALHAKPSGITNQSVGGSRSQSCQTSESVLDVGVTIGDVVPVPNFFTTYSNMVREKGNVEETSNELDIYLMEKIEMPTPNRLAAIMHSGLMYRARLLSSAPFPSPLLERVIGAIVIFQDFCMAQTNNFDHAVAIKVPEKSEYFDFEVLRETVDFTFGLNSLYYEEIATLISSFVDFRTQIDVRILHIQQTLNWLDGLVFSRIVYRIHADG
nr:zinc finger BED domain-containing protein RICESLEEPER 2-like [Ipomoea batatas]